MIELSFEASAPAVADLSSMIRSCISASGMCASITSQPSQPGRPSKPKIWPRRDEIMPLIFGVASEGTAIFTAMIGSSSTGEHFGMPSDMAMRPAVRNAISDESTV